MLVVEDDPDVLDVAVETLRMLGYEVLTAPDGPSALGRAAARSATSGSCSPTSSCRTA